MPNSNGNNTDAKKTKEWTLMFYFASDNPLGPTIVSQLKNLKNAGFDPEANVVAYYDPPIPGTPTHVFDVNIVEKIKAQGKARIGFTARDSFVRNMIQDKQHQSRLKDSQRGARCENPLEVWGEPPGKFRETLEVET